MMNLLFIGYWGANEGLSQATILPHLEILSKMDSVSKIVFCSIERNGDILFNISIDKVNHIPLYSQPSKIPLWDKINDFIDFPKQLISLCKEYKIEKIIGRGAPAGALAYKVYKKINLPFYVESFEPHANYMLDAGVWAKWDPRYLFQKRWEEKQKQLATALMPVSDNYRNKLVEEGVRSSKIDVIPCCVNVDLFRFNQDDRSRVRQKYNLSEDTTVGIYVGKFGGVYYSEEAFDIFKEIGQRYSKFHLIILTPNDKNEVLSKGINAGIKKEQMTIDLVPHTEVASYLSASDVAFSLHLRTANSEAFSPIKNGEYWANGLPVIISKGIGDDSDIIAKEKVGAIIDVKELDREIDLNFISRKEIQRLAVEHRSFSIAESVYKKWYS